MRGLKHVVKRGKTPVLTEEQARRPLESIKVARKLTLPDGSEAETPWLVGLRDRALSFPSDLTARPTFKFLARGGR